VELIWLGKIFMLETARVCDGNWLGCITRLKIMLKREKIVPRFKEACILDYNVVSHSL
jgi:hypothetical protein